MQGRPRAAGDARERRWDRGAKRGNPAKAEARNATHLCGSPGSTSRGFLEALLGCAPKSPARALALLKQNGRPPWRSGCPPASTGCVDAAAGEMGEGGEWREGIVRPFLAPFSTPPAPLTTPLLTTPSPAPQLCSARWGRPPPWRVCPWRCGGLRGRPPTARFTPRASGCVEFISCTGRTFASGCPCAHAPPPFLPSPSLRHFIFPTPSLPPPLPLPPLPPAGRCDGPGEAAQGV